MHGFIRLLTRLGLCLAALAQSMTLYAQIPNKPEPLRVGENDYVVVTLPPATPAVGSPAPQGELPGPIQEISRLFNDGDGKVLRAAATTLLRDLSRRAEFFDLSNPGCENEKPRSGFDLSKDYVFLSWVGLDLAAKRTPFRILVHDGADPYVMVLPGLSGRSCSSRIFDVFVSPLSAARHASSYTYTPQAAPADALVQPFLAAATGPLFASLSAIRGGAITKQAGVLSIEARERAYLPRASLRTDSTLLVQVGVLKPPLSRATVKGKDLVRQPQPWADFAEAATRLSDKLQFSDVRQYTCAVELAKSMLAGSLAVSARTVCAGDDGERVACRNSFDTSLELSASVAAAGCRTLAEREVRLANDMKPAAERVPEDQLQAVVDEEMKGQRAALRLVETQFRELIAGTSDVEDITAEFSLTNTPPTRWGFGAMVAYAYNASTDGPRVKVGNDGKFALNPLSRQLSLASVNLPVWGVDDSKAFSWRGLIRPFVGVVTTPEFGISAGANVAIWHGLGIAIGEARLAVPTLGKTDSLLQAPTDPNAPFSRTTGHARFWGISYNFPLK